MQGEEVALRQQLVAGRDGLDAELGGLLGGDERVEPDHLHVEADGAAGDLAADAAEADDAERLAGDLGAEELVAVPLAGLHGGVGGGDVAGQGEQQGDGVLGGRDGVAARGVHDDDAPARGGGDVDVVDADAGADDAAELAGIVEQVGGEAGAGADDGAVGGAEGGGEVGALEAGSVVEVDAGLLEDVEAGGLQLVANQHARHRGPRRTVKERRTVVVCRNGVRGVIEWMTWTCQSSFPTHRKRPANGQRSFSASAPLSAWREMAAMMAFGWEMVRTSPRRAEIERACKNRKTSGAEFSRRFSTDMAADSAIIPEDLQDALTAAADTLNAQNIAYAVIGGMAAGHRSQPRFTKDVDFLLQVPQIQLPGLLEALRQKEFKFDLTTTIREWTQHHTAQLMFRGIPVDWLKPVIAQYQHVLDRATEQDWYDHRIRVATVEGLILLKMLAYRTQDLLDIENLVAFHRNTLDLDWIRSEWQAIKSLDDPPMVRLLELVGERK